MSELLKELKRDLTKAMKLEVSMRKDEICFGVIYEAAISVKDVARSIISMFPEIGIKPDQATDEHVIQLLKKYITIEKTRELYLQNFLTGTKVIGLSSKELSSLTKEKINELGDDLTSMKIKIATSYLPEQVNETEIKKWISCNINLLDYKNKMQAMKPIMEHFKGVDGNVVKQIIMEM